MKLLSVTCLFLFLLSCKKSTDPCSTCPSNLACTNYYASATLKIQYANGADYILDSFKVIRKEDGRIVNVGASFTPGIYPVFNDGTIAFTDLCGEEFDFAGYKGGSEVVREPYVFSHDCCHMKKISGKTELIK